MRAVCFQERLGRVAAGSSEMWKDDDRVDVPVLLV